MILFIKQIMKFKIPLTFSDPEILRRRSKPFLKISGKRGGKLEEYLKASDQKIDKRQYISICYRIFAINLIVIFTASLIILGLLSISNFIVYSLGISLLFSFFVFIKQKTYPRTFSLNREKNIERNLLSSLQDMLVQLNSGIPIFSIIYNISNSDYGELSIEFQKIVKEINAGEGQIEAIENHGKLSTSKYFRRVLWQLSNAMRSGSDLTITIKEEIKNLSSEQVIQIQSYGSKLNPLVMFYLLIAVIIPSLGITFIIIISSMLGLSTTILKTLFVGIFFLVLSIQLMFLGLIKSKRPSLI